MFKYFNALDVLYTLHTIEAERQYRFSFWMFYTHYIPLKQKDNTGLVSGCLVAA